MLTDTIIEYAFIPGYCNNTSFLRHMKVGISTYTEIRISAYVEIGEIPI